MFFSKKRKEKKFRENEKRSFAEIVKLTTNSIYKLDSVIQTMLNKGDCHYDSISFVFRSIQDMIAAIDIYSKNAFTSPGNSVSIQNLIKEFKDVSEEIEEDGKKLSILVKNFNMTKRGIDELHESDMPISSDSLDRVMSNMFSMKMAAQQMTLDIHIDLTKIRSLLYDLRWIVSKDYISIIAGVDIELLDQYYHKNYEQIIHNEVMFDKISLRTYTKEET